MKEQKISAIIPAAGQASRMGRFKPLLPLGSTTIVERVVRLFQSAGISDIHVVTGCRASDMATALQSSGAKTVENKSWPTGMFSSIIRGVKNLNADREAFFVLPVDIPLVKAHTLHTLLQAYHPNRHNIIYPVFQGKRGHPPLISCNFVEEILSWPGDGGLRAFLAQQESCAIETTVADEAILLDLDHPEDYARLLDRYQQHEIPTARECLVLMQEIFPVEKKIFDHCRTVALVALNLGKQINRAGGHLDLALLVAAGLLHDLARKQADHALAGEKLLSRMGYQRVAEIVGAHMHISIQDRKPVSEKEIIYLADKLVQGDRIVPFGSKHQTTMARHADNPEALDAITARLDNARTIKNRLETLTGRALEELVKDVSEEDVDDLFA